MSEHSKGPWTLDKHGDVRDANGKRVRLVGVSLACGYAPDDREPEANRALVAAAPELVEAVQRAARWLLPWPTLETVCVAEYEAMRTAQGWVNASAYNADTGHLLDAFTRWVEDRKADDLGAVRAALKKAGVEP